MKALPFVSIVIVGLVFISEINWLGRSELAPVIIGICVAIGLQGIYLVKSIKNK